MELKYSDIAKSYDYSLSEIKGFSPPYGQYSMSAEEVIKAHYLICEYFINEGSNLGGVGMRDANLLMSAVSRQFTEFGGKEKYSTDIHKCASLFYGIINNHPFHDANKRTAFLVCIRQLEKLGLAIKVTSKEFEDFTVEVAEKG